MKKYVITNGPSREDFGEIVARGCFARFMIMDYEKQEWTGEITTTIRNISINGSQFFIGGEIIKSPEGEMVNDQSFSGYYDVYKKAGIIKINNQEALLWRKDRK